VLLISGLSSDEKKSARLLCDCRGVPTWAEQSEAHTDDDNWCASIVNLEQ